MVGTVAVCDQAEEALADSRPFGNCNYILGRLFSHYQYRLGLLSEHTEAASVLLSALEGSSEHQLRRVLGDPVVRVAIDSTLANLNVSSAPSIGEAGDIFKSAAYNLIKDYDIPPLADGSISVLGVQEDSLPWIWMNERVSVDPLGSYFRQHYSRHVRGLGLASPGPEICEMLSRGAALLRMLCPKLSRSALGHVHLVAVVNTMVSPGFTSLTTPAIPGLVVLAPSVLKSPLDAAAFLLHEAMHSKFVDLEHTHSLMHAGYNEMESPRIRPHWNRVQPGQLPGWSVNRSLTVCHVYVSLALLYIHAGLNSNVVDQFGSCDGSAVAVQVRRSLDRAHYLQQQLVVNRAQLGAGGALFVDWLGAILAMLDPAPPPRDSYVHLALDLYDREAEKIQEILQRVSKGDLPAQAGWASAVRNAGRREIRGTVDSLSLLNQAGTTFSDLQSLDLQLLSLDELGAPFSESATIFLAARRANSIALRSIPLESYSRRNPHCPNRLVGDLVLSLVEESGRELHDMLSMHLP